MVKDKPRGHVFDPGTVLNGRGAGQERRECAPGNLLYAQGEPGDAVFFIEIGWIKLATVVSSGREAVIALRGPGEFAGSRCLLGLPRTASATALTRCTCVRVTRAAFLGLVREVPDFAAMFTTYLLRQGMHDQENVIDQLTQSAEQRLARMLLRLANSGTGEGLVPAKISQALFAKMIGTTRSRVSFFMNRFKRLGFIDYGRDGRVRVHKSLRNAIVEDWFNS